MEHQNENTLASNAQSPLSQMLSPDTNAIRARRAQQVIGQIKLEQEALITNLKREVSTLETKLDDLSDLGPDDTTSLRTRKDFNAASWVQDVQDVKEQLLTKRVSLQIAEETLKEFSKA